MNSVEELVREMLVDDQHNACGQEWCRRALAAVVELETLVVQQYQTIMVNVPGDQLTVGQDSWAQAAQRVLRLRPRGRRVS